MSIKIEEIDSELEKIYEETGAVKEKPGLAEIIQQFDKFVGLNIDSSVRIEYVAGDKIYIYRSNKRIGVVDYACRHIYETLGMICSVLDVTQK